MADSYIAIDGYNFTRMDRVHLNKRNNLMKSGGLVTYVRHDLTFSSAEYDHLNLINEHIEMQWVVIKKGMTKSLLVVNLYKPPKAKSTDFSKQLSDNLPAKASTTLSAHVSYTSSTNC